MKRTVTKSGKSWEERFLESEPLEDRALERKISKLRAEREASDARVFTKVSSSGKTVVTLRRLDGGARQVSVAVHNGHGGQVPGTARHTLFAPTPSTALRPERTAEDCESEARRLFAAACQR